MGYSEMMTERSLGPQDFGKYDGYPPIVLRSGRHLLRIVDEMLDVSKLEAGAMDLSEDVIDVSQMIGNAIKFVAPSAHRDGVALEWEAPERLPYLAGDATRVRQIVLNLLSNAVKFTPEGGTVTITAADVADDGLEIVVADTGIGISPEDIENVLVPFARMENREHLQRVRSLKPDSGHSSTGLGLPLVKLLCDLHGAEFELTSSPDVGTRARVRFPADRVLPGENVAGLRAVS
ncbi:MAG: HAMP domain-containing histidine kinase, partial [Alphaproteobacteria bacterium]|nr:HAMP domain-containing histidine kinase [Alphaproteobacteria bacterium]